MNFSAQEREVVGVCIALEALDDIVNHSLLDLHNPSSSHGESEVHFPTSIHQKMFLIRLLDFVKEEGDGTLTGVQGSCLAILRAACTSRAFDVDNSVMSLRNSTSALAGWLDAKKPLTLRFPTLDIEVTLNVPRLEFVNIGGNQAKHNTARLTRLSQRIAKLLRQSGHDIASEQIPLALSDLHEQLGEDYFVYYCTWLSELMNNVRWGVQDYLCPTYQDAYTPRIDGGLRYTYRYPAWLHHPIAQDWFFRLMNRVRSGPRFRRFVGSRYLKREILR